MHSAHELTTRWPELDVAGKRARLDNSLHVLSGFTDAAARSAAGAERAACGLWQADASAWSADPATQHEIGKWLGWMQSPMLMADSIERLQTFAASIKRNGFTDIVLLGMGGSSLAPEVLRAVVGVAPGYVRATTSRCWPISDSIRRWPPRCRRGATRFAIARGWRRCSGTGRGICTRPGSCTRAGRTAVCSC